MYIGVFVMLENNKCILAYGLSNTELLNLKELGYKIIEITPEMFEMTLNDVLLGMRLEVFNNNLIKEKIILYNNLSQCELKKAIMDTKQNIKDGILAVVTQKFINWKISYLINNLIYEKEWYSKVRKEESHE